MNLSTSNIRTLVTHIGERVQTFYQKPNVTDIIDANFPSLCKATFIDASGLSHEDRADIYQGGLFWAAWLASNPDTNADGYEPDATKMQSYITAKVEDGTIRKLAPTVAAAAPQARQPAPSVQAGQPAPTPEAPSPAAAAAQPAPRPRLDFSAIKPAMTAAEAKANADRMEAESNPVDPDQCADMLEWIKAKLPAEALEEYNAKLVKLKRRKLTYLDLAMMACIEYRNIEENSGQSPRNRFTGYAAKFEIPDGEWHEKAVSAGLRILVDIGFCKLVKPHDAKMNLATTYALCDDPYIAVIFGSDPRVGFSDP